MIEKLRIDKLDWNNKNIKKDWCLLNTKYLFWMSQVNMGPDANSSLKYTSWNLDISTYWIGDILVIGSNSPVFTKSPAGTKYWHIGVIIGEDKDYIIMSDGRNAYPNLHISKFLLQKWKYWIITPQKMIELGATRITLQDTHDLNYNKPTMNTIWYYEKIFNEVYKTTNIYWNMDEAKKQLWDVAFFIAIGLERLKLNNNLK